MLDPSMRSGEIGEHTDLHLKTFAPTRAGEWASSGSIRNPGALCGGRAKAAVGLRGVLDELGGWDEPGGWDAKLGIYREMH